MKMFLRAGLALLLLGFASQAWAQTPVEDASAPVVPPLQREADEPDEVSIHQRDGGRVEEYRANGRVFMIKVIPALGPAYYLVDRRGDGHYVRRDNLDSGLVAPLWPLLEW